MEVKELQALTGRLFRESFGRTALTQRLDDISGEATELCRFIDMENLREEAGDLLCSVLALCQECGFKAEDLVLATHAKIHRRQAQYRALGRKVKVALLGGAFDPPTLGHLAVAKFVLDSSRTFDEVWFTPCYQHMFNKEMAPAEARIKMCTLMAASDGRIRVFDYEIRHKLRGETYNFVQRLLDEPMAQNEYDFSLIIGMDNANTFDKWVNFQELERSIRFVVVPRTGEEPDPQVDWYLKPPHIFLRPDKPLPNVSSTQAREVIAGIKDAKFPGVHADQLRDIVDPVVLQFLALSDLYQCSE